MAFAFQVQGGRNAKPIPLPLACDPDVQAANSPEALQRYLETGDPSGLTIPDGATMISVRALGKGEGVDIARDVAGDPLLHLGMVVHQRIWGDAGPPTVRLDVVLPDESTDDDGRSPTLLALCDLLADVPNITSVDANQHAGRARVALGVDGDLTAIGTAAVRAALALDLGIAGLTLQANGEDDAQLEAAASLPDKQREALGIFRRYSSGIPEKRARVGLLAFDGKSGPAAWARIEQLAPDDRAAAVAEIARHIARLSDGTAEGKG